MTQKVWVVSVENVTEYCSLKLFRRYEDAKTDAIKLAKRMGIVDDAPDTWNEGGGHPSLSFGFDDAPQVYLQPYDLN